MNFKRYHVSKNLCEINGFISDETEQKLLQTVVLNAGTYTYSCMQNDTLSSNARNCLMIRIGQAAYIYESTQSNYHLSAGKHTMTFTVPNDNTSVELRYWINTFSNTCSFDNFMLNTGSTALPYEPYSSEVWHNIPHYIHNTSTDTIATLPVNLYPNDTTATVGLKGNMEQNGTPTPQNPIQPQETGDRTGNLFDYNAYFNSIFTRYNEFFDYSSIQLLPNTTYTLSTSFNEYGTNPRTTVFIVGTTNQIPTTADGGISNISPVTITTENDGILKLYKRISGGFIPTKELFDNGDWLMLNTGSTALPYEPYGVKIPISSTSTTANIYLGEAQTTRKIKKLVLTGEETDWGMVEYYNYFRLTNFADGIVGQVVCSHYVSPPDAISIYNTVQGIRIQDSSSYGKILIVRPPNFMTETLSGFKTYLQQQYAAGTPVTVWYALADPTTGIVNEPIRKIGDYADTVSGITIPTTAGANSFDVLTTLKPSEVTVNYKGWHTGAVHERDSGQWD